MKKHFLCLLIFFSPLLLTAQAKHDSVSVLLLDRMSGVIGDLTSFNLILNTTNDIPGLDGGTITQFFTHKVTMSGPDKMVVNTDGAKGHYQYWYDGSVLVYYSYDENNFASIPAPNTIMSTIDSLHSMYQFEFPAADLFYATLTDDMIEYFDEIKYVGNVKIDNKSLFQIHARSEQMEIQLWILDDTYNLPYKYLIIDKRSPERLQYEATFLKWDLNPDMPQSIFNFTPPPGAKEIKILSVNDVKN